MIFLSASSFVYTFSCKKGLSLYSCKKNLGLNSVVVATACHFQLQQQLQQQLLLHRFHLLLNVRWLYPDECVMGQC